MHWVWHLGFWYYVFGYQIIEVKFNGLSNTYSLEEHTSWITFTMDLEFDAKAWCWKHYECMILRIDEENSCIFLTRGLPNDHLVSLRNANWDMHDAHQQRTAFKTVSWIIYRLTYQIHWTGVVPKVPTDCFVPRLHAYHFLGIVIVYTSIPVATFTNIAYPRFGPGWELTIHFLQCDVIIYPCINCNDGLVWPPYG